MLRCCFPGIVVVGMGWVALALLFLLLAFFCFFFSSSSRFDRSVDVGAAAGSILLTPHLLAWLQAVAGPCGVVVLRRVGLPSMTAAVHTQAGATGPDYEAGSALLHRLRARNAAVADAEAASAAAAQAPPPRTPVGAQHRPSALRHEHSILSDASGASADPLTNMFPSDGGSDAHGAGVMEAALAAAAGFGGDVPMEPHAAQQQEQPYSSHPSESGQSEQSEYQRQRQQQHPHSPSDRLSTATGAAVYGDGTAMYAPSGDAGGAVGADEVGSYAAGPQGDEVTGDASYADDLGHVASGEDALQAAYAVGGEEDEGDDGGVFGAAYAQDGDDDDNPLDAAYAAAYAGGGDGDGGGDGGMWS